MSQDTLSDVLRNVRLRGAVFFYVTGSGEWAAEAPASRDVAPRLIPGAEHVMEYHAVVEGSCWASIPGGSSAHLTAGDIVMVPHGDPHVVSSGPGMRGAPALEWFKEASFDELPLRVEYNGVAVPRGESPARAGNTTVICGFLGCDLRPFNPLIAALPRLLHLRAADDDGGWISQFMRQAVSESRARRPGGSVMLARMSEMMFVDAVRRYADRLPAGQAGWLAGLRDRFVGRALALLHGQPGRDWSIEEVSREIGLSRSALHERFVELIGVAPMQYLAQWRMQAATRLLMETHATVAAIAVEVGYESEAAFTRAFKRMVGKPPAAWRRGREVESGGRHTPGLLTTMDNHELQRGDPG